MKRFLLSLALIALPTLANAQTPPIFTHGQAVTSAQLNQAFATLCPLGGCTFTGQVTMPNGSITQLSVTNPIAGIAASLGTAMNVTTTGLVVSNIGQYGWHHRLGVRPIFGGHTFNAQDAGMIYFQIGTGASYTWTVNTAAYNGFSAGSEMWFLQTVTTGTTTISGCKNWQGRTVMAGQYAVVHAIFDGTNCYIDGGLQPAHSIVTNLPSCTAALDGAWYEATDATAPTYNGSLTGSGSVVVPVYCNGTSWTSH